MIVMVVMGVVIIKCSLNAHTYIHINIYTQMHAHT